MQHCRYKYRFNWLNKKYMNLREFVWLSRPSIFELSAKLSGRTYRWLPTSSTEWGKTSRCYMEDNIMYSISHWGLREVSTEGRVKGTVLSVRCVAWLILTHLLWKTSYRVTSQGGETLTLAGINWLADLCLIWVRIPLHSGQLSVVNWVKIPGFGKVLWQGLLHVGGETMTGDW